MSELITPEQLPKWVPGDLTLDTEPLGWEGLRLRGYRYGPLDVYVPPMRDCMVVAYGRGVTPTARQCVSRWRNECVAPGNVSLLTHQAQAYWRWSHDVEVMHLYLSPAQLSQVAAEMFDRHIEDIELFDVLKAEDAALSGMVWQLVREARGPSLGGRLYADALMNQACVHILRSYANVRFREPDGGRGLSPRQQRQLVDYIQANIERNPTLAELAQVAGLSVYCLARRFRDAFGVPPHEFVLRERVALARRLLARGDLALKLIACRCGFADQSHMTRVFRRVVGLTPGRFRAAHS